MKHEILQTDLPEDPFLAKAIVTAFPAAIRDKYPAAMSDHSLKRDIIATQLSNQIINEMGITYVYRLQAETGATVAEIVRAHAVASRVFSTHELQDLIVELPLKISLTDQYDILYNLRNLINLATRWFLHYEHLKDDLGKVIEHFSTRVKKLEALIPNLMSGFTKHYLQTLTEKFESVGLPAEVARRIAIDRAIYTSLNVIDVATQNDFDLERTARVYFAGGERINLVWFRDQIANDAREGHWNTLARLTLRDELDISQRALTISILNNDKKEKDTTRLIDQWIKDNERPLQRWERLLAMLTTSSNLDYTMFFIAIRELRALVLGGIREGKSSIW